MSPARSSVRSTLADALGFEEFVPREPGTALEPRRVASPAPAAKASPRRTARNGDRRPPTRQRPAAEPEIVLPGGVEEIHLRLASTVTRLREELADLRGELPRMVTEPAPAVAGTGTDASVDAAPGRVAELESRVADAEARAEQAQVRIAELEAGNVEAADGAGQAQARLAELEAAAADAALRVTEAEARAEAAQTALAELRTWAGEAQTWLAQAEARNGEVESRAVDAESRVELAQGRIAELEAALAQTVEAAEAAAASPAAEPQPDPAVLVLQTSLAGAQEERDRLAEELAVVIAERDRATKELAAARSSAREPVQHDDVQHGDAVVADLRRRLAAALVDHEALVRELDEAHAAIATGQHDHGPSLEQVQADAETAQAHLLEDLNAARAQAEAAVRRESELAAAVANADAERTRQVAAMRAKLTEAEEYAERRITEEREAAEARRGDQALIHQRELARQQMEAADRLAALEEQLGIARAQMAEAQAEAVRATEELDGIRGQLEAYDVRLREETAARETAQTRVDELDGELAFLRTEVLGGEQEKRGLLRRKPKAPPPAAKRPAPAPIRIDPLPPVAEDVEKTLERRLFGD